MISIFNMYSYMEYIFIYLSVDTIFQMLCFYQSDSHDVTKNV